MAAQAWMNTRFFATTIRDPKAGASFRRIAEEYSFWGFTHQSPRDGLNPPAIGRLAEIGVPTLIVTAEHDVPACIEVADLVERSVTSSRKIVMPGTGHLLHMERPAEFNRLVLAFLDSSTGRGP